MTMDDKSEDQEKISNREQLDKPLTVVTPRMWTGLMTLMSLMGIVLLWSIFGSIPIKVEGKGIVLNQKGELLSVQAIMGGTIGEINAVPGRRVKKGELIAKIIDPQETFKFEGAKTTVEHKKRDLEKIKADIERESAANRKAVESELAARKYNVKQLEDRIVTLEGDVAKKRKLTEEGLISPIALHEAEDKLINSHIELETVKATIENLNYNLVKGYRTEDLKGKEQDYGKAVDELQLLETRQPLYNILSPTDGTVLELRVSEGDVIQPGAPVAWMEASNGETSPYVFYGYFPLEQGKRISVGNEIQFELSTVDSQEYGYVLGIVRGVSGYAVSKESILKTVRNKELVDYLNSGAEAVVQVTIEPEIDPLTNEYKWTSGKTPPIQITTGTVGKMQAIIHRIRPIYYVLPVENL
jgi:HlyD family secretion protein